MKYWAFLILIGSLSGFAQDPALHNLRALIKPPVYKVGDSRFFENDEYVDVTVQLKIADSTQDIPE